MYYNRKKLRRAILLELKRVIEEQSAGAGSSLTTSAAAGKTIGSDGGAGKDIKIHSLVCPKVLKISLDLYLARSLAI